MSGPATGRRSCATFFRAVLACLAIVASIERPAQAQTITPDLFRPVRDGFVLPQNSPLRRIGDNPGAAVTPNDPSLGQAAAAPSRIGQLQSYGVPAANGA